MSDYRTIDQLKKELTSYELAATTSADQRIYGKNQDETTTLTNPSNHASEERLLAISKKTEQQLQDIQSDGYTEENKGEAEQEKSIDQPQKCEGPHVVKQDTQQSKERCLSSVDGVNISSLKEEKIGEEPSQSSSLQTSTRRRFLHHICAGTGLSIIGLHQSTSKANEDSDSIENISNIEESATIPTRLNEAWQIRQQVADRVIELSDLDHPVTNEKQPYNDYRANYTKALPHDNLGRVDPRAYEQLVNAIESGTPASFEAIQLGGTRQLISPQAALAFELTGADPHAISIPPFPAYESAEHAVELLYVYWQALARDIPFREYTQCDIIKTATKELDTVHKTTNVKFDNEITPSVLFRGGITGINKGPYISQFLWKDAPLGAQKIEQRIRTLEPNVDYLTDYKTWLSNMRGQSLESGNGPKVPEQKFDSEPRYIRTGRDLAACVQRDVVFQPYLIAVMVLIGRPVDGIPPNKEIYDSNNPYIDYENQAEFVNFGRPGILDLVSSVAQHAHSAAWFHKWAVHRRCRPEKVGGYIHNHLTSRTNSRSSLYEDLFDFSVFERTCEKFGSYLLPQAFREGCSAHPSYPSGHATVAGACATILKAVFNEEYVIENPVQATTDGKRLESWSGEKLTVRNEINKLASNIIQGRNFAGIHFMSDMNAGLRLGEKVAIRFLQDEKLRLNEDFNGYQFTSFNGEDIII